MVNKILLHENYPLVRGKGGVGVFPSYTTHSSQIKGSKVPTPCQVLHFALEHVLVTLHGLIRGGHGALHLANPSAHYMYVL